jgi:hypothetical protein
MDMLNAHTQRKDAIPKLIKTIAAGFLDLLTSILRSVLRVIMTKSCIVCRVEASPDLKLQYCAGCQSALYCSKACQTKDWKDQHKKICNLLNVGHGDMQVRTVAHMSRQTALNEGFERSKQKLTTRWKDFFERFEKSTFEKSQAMAQSMTNFARTQTKLVKRRMFFHSLQFLVRFSNSKMLSWPNSPLLVMLQFVNPSERLIGDQDQELHATPLLMLADLADPIEYSTHVNQLILAKQLVARGAEVNAVSIPKDETPLHRACFSHNVTNLVFVEYLLGVGANPNAQDHLGHTPLMYTTSNAPGAAKFLLNSSTADAKITSRSGQSFQSAVHGILEQISDKLARPDIPDRVQQDLLLQQWRGIEKMLVLAENRAADTGIAPLE